MYLHNPNTRSIFLKYANRILTKQEAFNTKSAAVKQKIDLAESRIPNPVEVFFSDVFYEPNYNLSYAKDQIDTSSKNYEFCQTLFSDVKYNSAIACLSKSKEYVDDAGNIVDNENNVKREFDVRWEQFGFIALVAIAAFIIIKSRKEARREGNLRSISATL